MRFKFAVSIILFCLVGMAGLLLAFSVPANGEQGENYSEAEKKAKLEIYGLLDELDCYDCEFVSEKGELINWWSMIEPEGGWSTRDIFHPSPDQPVINNDKRAKALNDKFKTTLGASDEEWVIIRSRLIDLIKVTLKHDLGRSRGMEGGKPIPYMLAGQKLYQLVAENKNAGTDQIKQAIEDKHAAQEARNKEEDDARQRLREVLTVRQEALFILMGVL